MILSFYGSLQEDFLPFSSFSNCLKFLDSQASSSLSPGMGNQKSSGAICSFSTMLSPNHRALGGRKPMGTCSHLGECTPGPPMVVLQGTLSVPPGGFPVGWWLLAALLQLCPYSVHIQALLRCLHYMCRSRTSLCVSMHCSDLSLPTQSPREGSEMGRGESAVALPPTPQPHHVAAATSDVYL